MTDPATAGGYPPASSGQSPYPVPGQFPGPGPSAPGHYPAPPKYPAPGPASVPPPAPRVGYPPPAGYQPPPPAPRVGYPPPAGYMPPPPVGYQPPPAGHRLAPSFREPLREPPRWGSIARAVVVIVGLAAVVFGLRYVIVRVLDDTLDVDYSVGKCLDQLPVSDVETDYDGSPVPCDSAEAVAKIVEVHDGATLDQAERLCLDVPGYVAAVSISRRDLTRVLCLAEA